MSFLHCDAGAMVVGGISQVEQEKELKLAPKESTEEQKTRKENLGSEIRSCGTSMVVQWLRIRLPMQGTWVRALVREDLTCCGTKKTMHHNY